MKNSFSDLTLIFLWIIAGISTLISGPTRLSYALIWICLLFELTLKYFKEKSDEDDDDTPGIA